MKRKKQQLEFSLNFINENASDESKKYPNVNSNVEVVTPLDEFPICYFKEEKKTSVQYEPTFVLDDKEQFVSPILGRQQNTVKSGEQSDRPKKSYESFGNNKVQQSRQELIKEFNLLNTDDYRNILINGIDDNYYQNSKGFELEKVQTKDSYTNYEYYTEKEEIDYEYDGEPSYIYEDELSSNNTTLSDTNNTYIEDIKVEEVQEVKVKQVKEEPSIKVTPLVKKTSKYMAPPLSLLNKNDGHIEMDEAWVKSKEQAINNVFLEFKYKARSIGYKVGPTVTLFLIDIEPGTDVGKLNSFAKTLQMRLRAKSIRIHTPVVGFDYAGIEIPNDKRTTVLAGNLINNPTFLKSEDKLSFALGLNISGEEIYANIEKMPHCLVAGATGNGKSVCIHSLIISLIYKNTPDELRFILVDPKIVEFTNYFDIPHLAMPVITEPKKAVPALKWLCEEMDRRFQIFSHVRARNIDSYNKIMKERKAKILPKIVIIIDELHNLMLSAANDVENYIEKLGSKARAAGIHMIVATQRPSTDVIKGTMKNNIPTRIAFAVTQAVDSFTILDHAGAEKLLGLGDMLYSNKDGEERVQGTFLSEDEITNITTYLVENNEVSYLIDENTLQEQATLVQVDEEDDELLENVAIYMVRNQTGSCNAIQTTFNVSFNRAKRILDRLESLGILSSTIAGKPREVLVSEAELLQILDNELR